VERPKPLAAVRSLAGHSGPVWSVAVAPDGQMLLSGGKDGTLRLWDLGGDRPVRTLAKGNQEIRHVAFAADGGRVFWASGASLRLLDLASGQEVQRFIGHSDTVRAAVLTADGKRLISAGEDRMVRVWDVQAGREMQRFGRSASAIQCLAL